MKEERNITEEEAMNKKYNKMYKCEEILSRIMQNYS